MIFPEIKHLYKYTSVNDKSLGILIKDEFWFSSPDKFNDPLDCGIQLLNNADKYSIISDFKNDLDKINIRISESTDSAGLEELEEIKQK